MGANCVPHTLKIKIHHGTACTATEVQWDIDSVKPAIFDKADSNVLFIMTQTVRINKM